VCLEILIIGCLILRSTWHYAFNRQQSNVLGEYAARQAKGGVYAQNGIQPFARGGIVNGPTLFPFAKGIGLMGEAGPEAIMPLRRGRDGNLGVMSSGGGTTNVVVNVDASGSSVEGDQAQAKALGNAISAAVQSELVKQKRPGGLLA
jgi:phage-related minor tail protein